MNDVEKLKAFHNIESFLDQPTKELLIGKLGLENANIDKRLPGLRVEDEFALILHFVENCKHIVSIDETTSTLTKSSYQNDYIVHFNNDQKIMIEIKNESKDTYKISEANFQKRLEFANDLGFELYFAVKIHGLWQLHSSEYVESKKYKLDIHDYHHSKLNEFIKPTVIIVPKGIQIKSTYTNKSEISLGIQHEEFGNLIHYQVLYNDKLIFEIVPENENDLVLSMIIELWHDRMEQTSVQNGDIVEVTEYNTEEYVTFDYQYFLSSIHHIVNDNENTYNSSSFLKSIASGEDNLMKRKIILAGLKNLNKLGIPLQFSQL